jgi:hypothetical protein
MERIYGAFMLNFSLVGRGISGDPILFHRVTLYSMSIPHRGRQSGADEDVPLRISS